MPAIKIQSTAIVSDPGGVFDVLRDDAILTNGSISLIDFAHSAGPLAAGMPANLAAVPNIAWKQAAAAHGSGTQAEWAHIYFQSASIGVAPQAAGGEGFVERTTKGGIHVCLSQSTGTGGKGVHIGRSSGGSSSKLNEYINAHPDNDFYFSLWQRITRPALAASPEEPSLHIHAQGSATGSYLALMNRNLNNGTGKVELNSPALPQPVGASFRSMSETAWLNTKPDASANVVAALMAVGYSITAYSGLGANKGRSTVLYRSYMEDLTVSGRTHAQVSAIDKALFDAAFAAGGRFYGDTFTDPATYP